MENWMIDNGSIKVLATTPIVADLVRSVGGEYVNVISLIGDDLDPHSYEMVKGDSEKFERAQVIFANGLSLEHSASIRYQLEQHPNVVFLGDSIKKQYPARIIYVDGEPDPHIWMDLRLWSHGVDFIVEKFSQIDPAHAADYATKGLLVKEALSAKDQDVRNLLQQIPDNKRYLVTAHDAFNYFGKRYLATKAEQDANTWWPRVVAIQGIAPDEQISSVAIARVVDHVIQYNIQVVFPEKNLSPDPLNKVVEACLKKGKHVKLSDEQLYGDTLGGRSYIGVIDHNATTIRNNL